MSTAQERAREASKRYDELRRDDLWPVLGPSSFERDMAEALAAHARAEVELVLEVLMPLAYPGGPGDPEECRAKARALAAEYGEDSNGK